MSKNTVKALSPIEITKQREMLEAQLANLETLEQAAKTEQANKVGEVIDTFPTQLAKILGREVSVSDLINLIKQKEKGVLGAVANTSNVDRSRRLNDDEKAKCRADLMARGIALQLGNPAEQMSVIATRYAVSVAALNTYKPTTDEVKAHMTKDVSAPVPAAS